MQVTHVNDYVTNATIGGKAPIEMTMDDSAGIFHMLSASLYSDQILAVVRETTCNAWDAHIESDNADLPIEITVSETELIIKDFGNGIPYELMGEIYGTYGKSTKVANDEVTGGYGLGCKSPFAYTDTFNVTSCHAGTKTIYRLTKSAGKVGGKPAIVPIVDVPTTETGLTVSIPIKSENKYRFTQLVKETVLKGGIKATLNGELLPTIHLENASHGFIFTTQVNYQSYSQIHIRLGNVVYPVPSTPEINEEIYKANQYIGNLNLGNKRFTLLLMAKPGSLSVPPSREHLSQDERTIENVIKLLKQFNDYMATNLPNAWKGAADKYVELLRDCKNPGIQYASLYWPSPLIKDKDFTHPDITTAEGFAQNCYNTILPDEAHKHFAHAYLQAMIREGLGNKKLLSSFYDEFKNDIGRSTQGSNWAHRKIFAPIHSAVRSVEPKGLVLAKSPSRATVPVNTISRYGVSASFSMLQRVVVIGKNNNDLYYRANWAPEFRDLGFSFLSLIYVKVPRNSKSIPAIKAKLEAMGCIVIDTSQRFPGEPPIVKPEAAEPKKVAKKAPGIATLNGMLDGGGKRFLANHIVKDKYREDTFPKIKNPAAIVQVFASQGSIQNLSYSQAIEVAKVYGDSIGMTFTDATYERAVEKYKTPPLKEFLLKRLVIDIKNSPECQFHIKNNPVRAAEGYYNKGFLKIFMSDPVLSKRFKLPHINVVGTTPPLLQLAELLLDTRGFFSVYEKHTISELISPDKLKVSIRNFLDKIDNVGAGYFDFSDITELFCGEDSDPQGEKHKEAFRKLFVSLLKD